MIERTRQWSALQPQGIARSQTPWATCVSLCVAVIFWVGFAVAEEEEPAVPPMLVARIQTDVVGEATRLWRESVDAVRAEQFEAARAPLVKLIREWGSVLLPEASSRRERKRPHRFLPAETRANRLISELPVDERVWYEAHFQPEASILSTRSRSGRKHALETLASRFAALKGGLSARLLLYERAAEAGDWHRAATHALRWLYVATHRSDAERATVALRYLDAITHGRNEPAISAFEKRFESLLAQDVTRGGVRKPLHRYLRDAQSRKSSNKTSAGRDTSQTHEWPVDPESLELRWTRVFDVSSELWDRLPADPVPLRRGATFVDDKLLIHEGAVVRCLDAKSGYEHWSFPQREAPLNHASAIRYREGSQPFRNVTLAGDLVLATLGDPAATGSYEFLGRTEESDSLGLEHRMRLVAIDAATGKLRWATGDATESDPILSSPACGCSSPPLVVGDAVYVTFAHFEGATALYGACLDRLTGETRWLTYLGGGESGRSGESGIRGRFSSTHVDAPPFGQRPALASGQLCFCPHAGFAAGVDAATGRVMWLRALPRFSAQSEWMPQGTSEGASLRNAPIGHKGTWLIAPMDSPDLLCLDAGTGELHWRASGWQDGDGPHHWRNLLGTAFSTPGTTVARLAGDRLYEVRMRDGHVIERELGTSNPMPFQSSHAIDTGSHCVSVAENLLRMERWAIHPRDNDEQVHWRIATLAPLMGASRADLTFDTNRLCVVTPDVVAVYSFRPFRKRTRTSNLGASSSASQPTSLNDVVEAARRITDAVTATIDMDRLVEVAERAAAARSSWTQSAQRAYDDVLLRSIDYVLSELDLIEDQERVLIQLAALARTLPIEDVGGIYRDVALGLLTREQHDVALPFLARWIEVGAAHAVEADGLNDSDGMSWTRGDLFAARLLEETLETALALPDSPGRASIVAFLKEREAQIAREHGTDLSSKDERELRESLPRAVGTKIAKFIREELLRRARARNDYVEAACLLSDLRLVSPWPIEERVRDGRVDEDPARAKHDAAYRLAMEEVEALANAYEFEAAENLLVATELHPDYQQIHVAAGNEHKRRASLVRGRIYGAVDAIPTAFRAAARRPQRLDAKGSGQAETGPRVLPLWPKEELARITPVELRAISPWSQWGPGAYAGGFGKGDKTDSTRFADVVFAQRGLGFELWSIGREKLIADIDLGDRGWFGSSLREVDRALPGGGVLVHSVVAKEPADRSGVRAGDWVREWNGTPVRTLNGFMSLVAGTTPGDTIPVKVFRRGTEVLSDFSAGRRPAAQGGLMDETPIWVDAHQNAIVVCRTGLHRIERSTGKHELVWRWVGDGLVRRLRVHGVLAFVVINQRLSPDVIVAVDHRTGEEHWRFEAEGHVTDLRPVGSAVLVQTLERRSAVLLDRWTGSARVTCRSIHQFGYDRAANWIDRTTAAPVAGQVFVLAGNRRLPTTLLVNSATGTVTWRRVARGGAGAPPMAVAGGFAAIPRSNATIDVLFPTLHGNGEPYRETIPFLVFAAADDRGGPLDFESRLFARGRTLYVLRLRNRGRHSALFGSTVHLRAPTPSSDRRRPSSLGDVPPQNETAAYAGIKHRWFASTGRLRRYVLAATVDSLGVVVSCATLSSEHQMWHEWLPSREAVGADPRTVLRAPSRDARRAPPVWSGGQLLVPVDEGLAIIPPEHTPVRGTDKLIVPNKTVPTEGSDQEDSPNAK